MKHHPYIGLLFKKNSAIIVMEFMDLKKKKWERREGSS